MFGCRCRSLLALAAVAFALQVPLAVAAPQSGEIRISGAWIRATPNGAATASAYLTIANRGPKPDRLIGGSAAGVDSILPHSMSMTGGVTRMRVLSGGLVIPPRGAVTLAPGGDHLMLTGLKHGFRPGQSLHVRLTFAAAGDMDVRFPVLAGPPAPQEAMGGMKMP